MKIKGKAFSCYRNFGLAGVVSALILLVSGTLSKLLGDKGLSAVERLVGLLLTAIAVQMLLQGIRQFVKSM